MTTSHPSRLRPVLWIAAIASALLLLATVERLTGHILPLPAQLGVAVAALGAATWLVLVYWGRIDEAAKEAQKSAWLWGGSAGTAVGMIADIAISLPGLGLYQTLHGAILHMGGGIIVGGFVILVSQVVGFLIAWAIWWAAKR